MDKKRLKTDYGVYYMKGEMTTWKKEQWLIGHTEEKARRKYAGFCNTNKKLSNLRVELRIERDGEVIAECPPMPQLERRLKAAA